MFMIMPLQPVCRFTFERSVAEGEEPREKSGIGTYVWRGGPGAVDENSGQGEQNAC